MTPKEKAKELTDKYIQYTPVKFDFENARQCALIAVDEILKSVPKQPSISITMPHFEATVYWELVRKEILNL